MSAPRYESKSTGLNHIYLKAAHWKNSEIGIRIESIEPYINRQTFSCGDRDAFPVTLCCMDIHSIADVS
jgi:hypothetical protein